MISVVCQGRDFDAAPWILYVFEELKLKKTQEKKFGVQMGYYVSA